MKYNTKEKERNKRQHTQKKNKGGEKEQTKAQKKQANHAVFCFVFFIRKKKASNKIIERDKNRGRRAPIEQRCLISNV